MQEIANRASAPARVATSAVELADSTNVTATRLGDSSTEIGEVVKVINAIATQTNLLALNATIEAARAGEAGKCFAVVAKEVKESAKETAQATEDISRRMAAIQTDSQGAVAAIGHIGSVITEIRDITTVIAGAVEEQSATAQEIARSVAEAAQGSGAIVDNITAVAQAAAGTTDGAADTKDASIELARVAGDLKQVVSRFRYEASTGSRESARMMPVKVSRRSGNLPPRVERRSLSAV